MGWTQRFPKLAELAREDKDYDFESAKQQVEQSWRRSGIDYASISDEIAVFAYAMAICSKKDDSEHCPVKSQMCQMWEEGPCSRNVFRRSPGPHPAEITTPAQKAQIPTTTKVDESKKG